MGNEVTIDALQIEIESNAKNAVSGLNALAGTLERLKSATKGGVGLTAVTRQLTSVKAAVSGMDASSTTGLAKAILLLRNLGNVKISSSVATQLNKINEVLPKLNVGNSATKIQELVTALKPLETLGKSSLGSTVNALTKLPEALSKIDMKNLYNQVQSLTRIMRPLAVEMEKIAAGFKAFPSRIQQLTQQYNKLTTSTNKVSKSFANFGAKLMAVYIAIRRVARLIASAINESNDYVENLNLFNVSMGEYASEAKAYAETVGELMGIDPSEWMRNQGIFMTLATGFGVVGDRAYTMSTQMTQLGYDIASFFNISVEDAMQKLQSGLSGELEPLRRIGYDLSQAKLEAVALSLGIDKAVSSMTQAEKAELRYYAIMTQVTSVQGDFSRTLSAPANQLRILKSEITQCARAIGNMFIPILNAVLPYVIAFFKVIRAVADIIAGLLGFELPEVDYSGISSAAGGADELSENLDNAGGAAKELKKYMMGFDELNVIDPTVGSGTGSDNYGGNGFDFELPTYDFIGEATESKVNQIVDGMKEWLGITDDIDSWADLMQTRFGNILTIVGLIGSGIALWKIGKGVAGVISTVSGLFGGKGGTGGTGGTGGSGFGVPKVTTILKGLADIAIIVGGVIALVAAVGLLTQIPGFNEIMHEGLSALSYCFTEIAKISPQLAIMGTFTVILGKIGVQTVAKGFADLAIIIGGIPVLITAIGALMSIPYFSEFLNTGIDVVTKVFKAIYDIALEIGIASAFVAILGAIGVPTIAMGLADLAIIIAGVPVLITAIGALMSIPYFSEFLSTGIDVVTKVFKGLYDIALEIGVLSGIMVVLGLATPAVIVSGLIGFAAVVGGIEVLLVALGALNQIPGFSWIVGEGGKVLIQLGDILGGFAGSIVAGFATAITDALPEIGRDLSKFMEEAEPFFVGLKNIDDSTLKSAGNLAGVILSITGTTLLTGLTSWLTGDNALVKFGEDLANFAPNFVKYSEQMKKVDTGVVDATSRAVQSVLEYANNVPNRGGVVSWFAGENDIDVFGEKLPIFGKKFKQYADSIKGINTDVIEASSTAAKSVVEFAKNIPNSGGVASWFAGDNDIDTFGEKLPRFGKNFKQYAKSIEGVKPDVIEASASSAEAIVAMCDKIPNSGGVASWFAGDNNIDTFGQKLVSFGGKFSLYYSMISTINTNVLEGITKGINDIIDFAIRIKDRVDINKVTAFADALEKLGKQIKNLPASKTVSIKVNVETISDGAIDAKVPLDIKLFASGGYPNEGQMFIAREAGPELVGNIGRRTAVVNNEQIVESIATGVADANGEQSMLLREQNSLLKALLDKETGMYIDGRKLSKELDRVNKGKGVSIIAGGAY